MKVLLLEESLESEELISDFVDIVVETTEDDFELINVSVGEQQSIQKRMVESESEKHDVLFTDENVDITIEEISKSNSEDDTEKFLGS